MRALLGAILILVMSAAGCQPTQDSETRCEKTVRDTLATACERICGDRTLEQCLAMLRSEPRVSSRRRAPKVCVGGNEYELTRTRRVLQCESASTLLPRLNEVFTQVRDGLHSAPFASSPRALGRHRSSH